MFIETLALYVWLNCNYNGTYAYEPSGKQLICEKIIQHIYFL